MAEYRKSLNRTVIVLLVALAGGGLFLGGRLIRDRVRKAAGVPLDEGRKEELRGELDHNPRSLFLYDPVISYRLKPSFRGLRHDSPADPHLTNSRGLLGEEEVDPDPAVRKLLFLGDSVAYGSHVSFEETFITRMGAAAAGTFQILNAGCPGWSTHQELEFYRLYLSDLPVEGIVIVFTLNDLLLFEWVWRDERSFQMSAELGGMGGLAQSRWTDWRLSGLRDGFREDAGRRPLAELNNTCLAAYLPGAWARYREEIGPALEKIAEGRAVVLAPVPARPQLEALNRGGDPETVLSPQRRLEELARKLEIEYLDLLPAFREEEGAGNDPLFLDDLHLSPEGHRRLAEWLWPRLRRKLDP